MLGLFRRAFTMPVFRAYNKALPKSSQGPMIELMKARTFKDIENILIKGVDFQVKSLAMRVVIRNYKQGKFSPTFLKSPHFQATQRDILDNLGQLGAKELADVVFALRSLKCDGLSFLSALDSEGIRTRIRQLCEEDVIGRYGINLFYDLAFLNSSSNELDLYLLKQLGNPNEVFNLVEIIQIMNTDGLASKASANSIVRAVAKRVTAMSLDDCSPSELSRLLLGFAANYTIDPLGGSVTAVRSICESLKGRVSSLSTKDYTNILEFYCYPTDEGWGLLRAVLTRISDEITANPSQFNWQFCTVYFNHMRQIITKRRFSLQPEQVLPILRHLETIIPNDQKATKSVVQLLGNLTAIKPIVPVSLLDGLFKPLLLSMNSFNSWEWRLYAIRSLSLFEYRPAAQLVRRYSGNWPRLSALSTANQAQIASS